LAVHRGAFPRGIPFQTGGGTARVVSRDWVIWANAPDKFESGTPAIVNIIAFAKALLLIRHFGNEAFKNATTEKLTATEILHQDDLLKYSGRELLDELRQTLIGRNVRVPTIEGTKPYINLDNGASTPTFTPIWYAVCQTWRQSKRVQEEIIHDVKSVCAEVLGAPLAAYDVIFTSNTTEAINLTAESLSNESKQGIEPVVLNTLLEHNSNELPWRMLHGYSMTWLSVDTEGFVNLNELDTILCAYNEKGQYGKKRITLVAISGASNVLGVFNGLAAISRITHRYGARLLVDAAQLIAHRKVDMERYGIDYLAFSAHKVYAPFGSGVLVVRKGLLNFSTAELETIQSSGEENIGGIAALGKALVLLQRIGMDLIQEEEQALTRRVLRGLGQITGLKIYGMKDVDSPRFNQKGGIIVFGLKGVMPNVVAKKLAEQGGIGVRYGCHCTHMLIKRLLNVHPLQERMQGIILILFPQVRLPGLVRVSLGIENSEEDVDTLMNVLDKIAQHRAGADRNFASMPNRISILSQKVVKQQMNDFTMATVQKVYSTLAELH
jgi:selenocysteine lyase/cysteine desulfurase